MLGLSPTAALPLASEPEVMVGVSDEALVALNESTAILSRLSRVDTLLPLGEESIAILASLSRQDTLTVLLEDADGDLLEHGAESRIRLFRRRRSDGRRASHWLGAKRT